ncbi:MAG: hypothetical protein ACRER2_09800 [Methylococcales bacterium]
MISRFRFAKAESCDDNIESTERSGRRSSLNRISKPAHAQFGINRTIVGEPALGNGRAAMRKILIICQIKERCLDLNLGRNLACEASRIFSFTNDTVSTISALDPKPWGRIVFLVLSADVRELPNQISIKVRYE